MRTVHYDPTTDCLTVDGVAFSASFLESFLYEGEARVITVWRRGNEVLCQDGAHPPGRLLYFSPPAQGEG